jgi:N utilization substance protein A
LAAKLLGWKVDIKSEEEKRQEVESAMAALVNPPEPVSSLIAYGLGEELAGTLAEAGVSTIDRLGGMTPEQLQEIPGIDPDSIENIRDSVTAYYAQFEEAAPGAVSDEADTGVEPEVGSAEPVDSEAAGETDTAGGGEPVGEATPAPEADNLVEPDSESGAAAMERRDVEMGAESDTIIDSGRVSHGESEEDSSKNE